METYDLWTLDTGNRIFGTTDESYARRVVRELLSYDLEWRAEDLSLGLPDGRVLDGKALAEWAT